MGQGGRLHALKFRSMVTDAEASIGLARQAATNDPRVTRVGRIMRATAMDELPQLWNIFVGDMSFVGPRALRPRRGRSAAETGVARGSTDSRVRRAPPRAPGSDRDGAGLRASRHPAPQQIPLRPPLIARQSFWLDMRLILLSFWITSRGQWETPAQVVGQRVNEGAIGGIIAVLPAVITSRTATSIHDVIVVGGGPAGLYAARSCRGAGGTWRCSRSTRRLATRSTAPASSRGGLRRVRPAARVGAEQLVARSGSSLLPAETLAIPLRDVEALAIDRRQFDE